MDRKVQVEVSYHERAKEIVLQVFFPFQSCMQSPTLPVMQLQHVWEGLYSHTNPFLVRGCAEFQSHVSKQRLIGALHHEPKQIRIYVDEEWGPAMGGAEVLQIWQKRKFNVIDSPCSDHSLKPPGLFRTNECQEQSLTYLITTAPAVTPVHTDSRPEGMRGDGFMYLVEGVKDWMFISPQDLRALEQAGWDEKSLKALSFTELLHIHHGFLWGRIQVCRITAGDFLLWPSMWGHRVLTSEHALGLTGFV